MSRELDLGVRVGGGGGNGIISTCIIGNWETVPTILLRSTTLRNSRSEECSKLSLALQMTTHPPSDSLYPG